MTPYFRIIGLGEVLWDLFPDGNYFGGAPANMACTAAGLLGASGDVKLISALGDDQHGREAVNFLEQRHVDVSEIQITDAPTGTVTVKLDDSGQPLFNISANSAWDNIVWSERWRDLAANVDAICFGSLAQRGNTSRETIQKFIGVTSADALKVFDMNVRAPFYEPGTLIQSLKLSNVLKLNDLELCIIAEILSISGDSIDVLKRLQDDYQISTIALTQGSAGAVLIHHSEAVNVPSVPTTVVDTVGAGDAFTAALIIGLLKNQSLTEIANFAIDVSSYVCSERGATPRLPDWIGG
jgi:fructokinase